MEDIDLNKQLEIEKMSPHEYFMHQQRVRDTVSSALQKESQKQIDKITVSSHANSFLDNGTHLRTLSHFQREFKTWVPGEALDPLMKTARKAYDSVRKDWLMSLTKVRDGVAPAENFYTYTVPGMSEKEHLAYRKLLRDNKNKNPQSTQGGGFPKRGRGGGRGGYNNSGYNNSRGAGHGRGGYNSGGGYDYGGFDPYQNQGEALRVMMVQNKVMKEMKEDLTSQNNYLDIAVRSLQIKNFLINRKLDHLKEDVAFNLSQLSLHAAPPMIFWQNHQVNPPMFPWENVYYNDSTLGRGHGGGGYNRGNNRGGGGRGGYRGNNYDNNQGGGGGSTHFGGNQASGGS